MTQRCGIAIIGGGAAGLAAAIFAGEALQQAVLPASLEHPVVVLDGATKLGAKILVSGGGRCNVTHDQVRPEDFNGKRSIIRQVLAGFDQPATLRWFSSLGVQLKREETGKLFPVSDNAHTVLQALLSRCGQLGVAVWAGRRVTAVLPQAQADAPAASPHAASPGFIIEHSGGTLQASQVILATGGRSLPRTGSDGVGWDFARALGHQVTPTFPALVPLVLAPQFFHAQISGLSCPAELATYAAGKKLDQRGGSLLWTHFGISGPLPLDSSRHWLKAKADHGSAELRLNLLPGSDFSQASQWLLGHAQRQGQWTLARVLAQRLPQRLAAELCQWRQLDSQQPLAHLARDQRVALVHALTELVLPVVGDRGWNYAEVTAGGVPLEEIQPATMGSRKTPGLYLIGEMLDCDGRIGGFNFQWAWSTGHLAGRSAAQALLQ